MTQGSDPHLATALRELAARRPLLVGLDFDGVLAPIVERPQDARALPGTLDAVHRLAAVAGVEVTLVSGRARDDLLALTQLASDGPVLLVGSHGAELGISGLVVDDAARERLERVRATLSQIAGQCPGAHVEVKPSAAVLHTRQASATQGAAATEAALGWLSEQSGVHVTRGKEVVEVAVIPATKGAAIGVLRERFGAAAVLYVGDDVTDETVFRAMGGADLSVKVGDGETAAKHRLPDPAAVQTLLRDLADHLGG